ncbi:hypothetical protein I5Q82_16060 [Acutalibacter muris]|uniref:Uncharacterized protein n=1 Tax=Acutalibacter muris TaxID=1796620 RepID=A0A1Z2XPB4_9FIRM|nr:hypothetical protein [Acutalibacter muris]ANU53082.1 hypothetical protein A4V00_03040 [Hungateiclostridiaceae bacterium KB18]ASB40241.1 hypothetical protein ADH66_05965 [Acutalibacter muris]QQR29531.1 hypothetical protein I5Q82_16060 [Acutalibacter muris]
MVTFRPGSHVSKLVALLSFVGEYPFWSLDLLGSERVYKALIVRLTQPEHFVNSQTGAEMDCRLFNLTGKGTAKSVRLYKRALPMLEWVHPRAYSYYMNAFWQHRFPGDEGHRERHFRVAEMAAMFMRAGFEVCPYLLPELQNDRRAVIVPEEPSLYLSRALKSVGMDDANKTKFTRVTGAAFAGGSPYAVYNTRNAVMKWQGRGEFKALASLTDIVRLNVGTEKTEAAILLGKSPKVALETVLDTPHPHRRDLRFDAVFPCVHFVPMDGDGIRQLKIMAVPNWKERILDALFLPETRSYGIGRFEYDACVEGGYVFSHLDSDLNRLIRFKEAIEHMPGPFEVLCFPHQVEFLREYLEGRAVIKTIGLEAIEQAFEIKESDTFE